jgi:outer membrane protein TolC
MKKITLILCMLPLFAMGQTLTLEECKQMAHDNYPVVKQYRLVQQTRDYTLQNIVKGWLPQVSANAGGYAFTDMLATSNQMAAMGMDMKNYMLNGSVTVNQNIYDGGQMAANKQVAEAQSDVQSNQLNVSMYEINDRVEQLYFGILLLDEQLAQVKLLQEDLTISNNTVSSMMKGGVANQSDLDAVRVEQVKSQQQQGSLVASRKAYLRMLGVFINKQLNENTQLERPSMIAVSEANNRPELNYYTAQSKLLDAQRKQLDTRLRPTISAFGMGMYHTKVMDMMKSGMLLGGLSVSWNIGALYTRKNDIKKLELQREQIESQRETFLFNNRLQAENTNGQIENLRSQITQDEEIVSLRESIRSKSEKKVKLGTESVNEMLRDINAVSQARQQKALHEIQLLKEIYNMKNINND